MAPGLLPRLLRSTLALPLLLLAALAGRLHACTLSASGEKDTDYVHLLQLTSGQERRTTSQAGHGPGRRQGASAGLHQGALEIAVRGSESGPPSSGDSAHDAALDWKARELLEWLGQRKPAAELLAEGALASPITNTDPKAIEILNVHSPVFINGCFGAILLAVIVACAVGCAKGDRWWIGSLVVTSYGILLPGLFCMDFSFNIRASTPSLGSGLIPSMTFQVTTPHGVPGPVQESTRSMVGLLWDTGSKSGAVMIAIFAFVVPAMKLVMLLIGELWRKEQDPFRLKVARWCILVVQMISKWASPDMFAFMLLYYLLRKLHTPPTLESLQVLDTGFTCYNIFCVTSVISTLAIQLPASPEDAKGGGRPRAAGGPARQFLVPIVALLFATWLGLFVTGILAPVLFLKLDANLLVTALGLPASSAPLVESVVESLDLASNIDQEVSVAHAVTSLFGWFLQSFELNLLLATVMLAVFAVGLTVLDMLILLVASLCAYCGDGSSETDGDKALAGLWWRQQASGLMKVTHVVRHLAMLDVTAAGVVVISFAAAIYKEQGIVIGLMWGIWVVVASEFIHYGTYFIVSWAVKSICASDGERL